jgi:hypothetical protein
MAIVGPVLDTVVVSHAVEGLIMHPYALSHTSRRLPIILLAPKERERK